MEPESETTHAVGEPGGSPEPCHCLKSPSGRLVLTAELGMDQHYAEVSVFSCPDCWQSWLRYAYELEAFSHSGRWYLGAIRREQFASLSVENARPMLERLGWYYYGGSSFHGKQGTSSGKISLHP